MLARDHLGVKTELSIWFCSDEVIYDLSESNFIRTVVIQTGWKRGRWEIGNRKRIWFFLVVWLGRAGERTIAGDGRRGKERLCLIYFFFFPENNLSIFKIDGDRQWKRDWNYRRNWE